MGQISNALGLGSEFEYGGVKYSLSPWTYKIQGLFERYLQECAIKNARRLGALLPADEAKDLLDRAVRDVTAGVYSFGSEYVAEAMKSYEHTQYLVWLMLRENHPEVKLDLVRQIFQEEMDLVLAKMNEANADPNPTPPSTPVGGEEKAAGVLPTIAP